MREKRTEILRDKQKIDYVLGTGADVGGEILHALSKTFNNSLALLGNTHPT